MVTLFGLSKAQGTSGVSSPLLFGLKKQTPAPAPVVQPKTTLAQDVIANSKPAPVAPAPTVGPIPGGTSIASPGYKPPVSLTGSSIFATPPPKSIIPSFLQPFENAGAAVQKAFVDAFNDTANKVTDAAYSVMGLTGKTEPSGVTMQQLPADHQTVVRASKAITAGLSALNIAFLPISAGLQGAEQIPGIGLGAKLVNTVFSDVGEVGTTAADGVVNNLPISDTSKEALRPAIEGTFNLLAQMALGSVAHEVIAPKLEAYQKTMSDIILKEQQTNPDLQRKVPVTSEGGQTNVNVNTPPKTKVPITSKTPGEIPVNVNAAYTPENALPIIDFGKSKKAPVETPTRVVPLPNVEQSTKTYSELIAEAKKATPKSDYLPLPESITSPSKTIAAQRVPGTAEPSSARTTDTGTLGNSGLNDTLYSTPSSLKSFSNIYDNISTIREQAQANSKVFASDIQKVTGVKPETRIKGQAEIVSKLNRLKAEGRSPTEINDIIGSRVTVPAEDVNSTLKKFQDNFKVLKIKNYLDGSSKNEWGYRGINIVTELPNNAGLAEFQIHTPEQRAVVDEQHHIYEKWRERDLSKLTPAEKTALNADIEKSKALTANVKAPVQSIDGTGKTKTRGLSAGVEAKAIENKLTTNFGDLPEYKVMDVKDQANKAADIVNTDYEKAKRIAMGTETSPQGLHPEAVYTAVEMRATKEGDVNTLRDLATRSTLTTEATSMGQRIKLLDERNPESPVKAIRDVVAAREAKLKRSIKDVAGEKKAVVSDIQSEIKSVKPKKQNWNEFIKSIQC